MRKKIVWFCKGVFLAGCIAKPENGKIPIQILNTRESKAHLSYFRPEIEYLREYKICTFDKIDKNSKRVHELLFSLHLNKDERSSIQNICAKYNDVFYLPDETLTTANICEAYEIKTRCFTSICKTVPNAT